MRIAFLGSKTVGYHCLQDLLDRQEELGIEIAGVLTNNHKLGKDLSVAELAQSHGISVKRDAHELASFTPFDYIISVQYHAILTQEQIDLAQKGAINLHMAPLPEYRGCNQFSYAIINGDDTFGTTLHEMTHRIDAGNILAESRFPILADDMVTDLYDRTCNESVALFKSSIKDILNGNVQPIPQAELAKERGTSLHFRKEIENLKRLSLDWDREKMERHIRATYMPGFPPPYFEIDGKKFEINLNNHSQ